MQEKKQQEELDMEQQTGSKLGQGLHQSCILSHCLFNLYAGHITQNAGLDDSQAGIKIARRNIENLKYEDDTTLMAENEEELKSLKMKVKEESKKAGLKLNIQKMKTMASGPITSRQIDEEKVETASDFIFLGSKITADGDYSHKIKRCLLLWRISMTNLDSVLKSTHFADKGPYRQSYGFFSSHIWMWELYHKEGRAPKIWYFWTVLLEKTLESLLDSMEIKLVNLKGNQPWIFIGKTEAKVEAPILWQSDVKS